MNKVEEYKYSFDTFKRDKGRSLPDDINRLIEEAVAPLQCEKLSPLLERIRVRRLFGTVTVYDKRGSVASEIKFQSGICSDFNIIENPADPYLVKPLHPVFRRSEKNKMVSFQKKQSTEEAQ